jgi:tetratricopeptide (TPR) repeat protein
VLVAQDGSYRFVHPLVATVVRQDLTPMRRAFLHRRAAQALERAHAPRPDRVAGQLMEHLAAAGERERAAHYAERAATQALAVGAFVEAVAYAQRALDWEPTAQRQLLLGETLWIAGDASTAQAQLEAALRGHEAADDPVGVTRASMMLAQLAISKSQPADARAWLERAPIGRVQATEPALGIQAHLLAAAVARQSQAYEAAEAQLDQAALLIRQQQLPLLATPILFERGNLLANRGDLRAALDAFGETLRLAQAAANPAFEVMARNNLAYHSLLAGDLASAQEHIRTAGELMERYGLSFLRQYVHSTAGEIALTQGRLDAADSAFASALEAARAWDNRVHMANVRASQAMVARARGDQAQARALLAEAREWFGDAIDPFVRDKIMRTGKEIGD